MPAKPWSASSIASVAGQYTDLRISGDVKQQLVGLLLGRLDQLLSELEQSTLENDPQRKTLADPDRERLGFSRTRGLLTDRITKVDSVGAAAVTRVNEELESYLEHMIGAAGQAAASERVGTIKSRHMQRALESLGHGSAPQADGEPTGDDPLEEMAQAGGRGMLTAAELRRLARTLARMPVTDECIEELLLLYADYASELEHKLKAALFGNNLHALHDSMKRLEQIRQMGFMRRMLSTAGERAREQGAKRVEVGHVIDIDPFEHDG